MIALLLSLKHINAEHASKQLNVPTCVCVLKKRHVAGGLFKVGYVQLEIASNKRCK